MDTSSILEQKEREEMSINHFESRKKMLEKPTSWGCSSNHCGEKAVHYVRELKIRDGFEIVEGRNACRKHL